MSSSVAIIMPTYNSEKFIEQSVESIIAQSYQNWTLYLSDDGSDDRTLQIVKDYARQDDRINIITSLQKGTGAAKTRNRVLEMAKSDYVAFLDSDDMWTPQKLKKQIHFMQENDLALSFTLFDAIDENGHPLDKNQRGKAKVSYKDFLLNKGKIGCLTVMYDRRKTGDILMPDILKRQDYAMWLKIMKLGYKAHRLEERLAIYRIRKNSVSSNKIDGARYMWKVYHEVEGFNYLKSSYYFFRYAIYHMTSIISAKLK